MPDRILSWEEWVLDNDDYQKLPSKALYDDMGQRVKAVYAKSKGDSISRALVCSLRGCVSFGIAKFQAMKMQPMRKNSNLRNSLSNCSY